MEELLLGGADPEERHEGWTPLMKAAEEGAVEVMQMLLDKKVDLEAHNRKERTALSFAAAPSNEGQGRDRIRRSTPVDTLRLLLEHGADPKRKNFRGFTPKELAAREKREDGIAIFDEFGF